MDHPHNNLVDLLEHRAAEKPDLALYTFEENAQETHILTTGGLAQKARSVAMHLLERHHRGDRVLLLFPPGLSFIQAFFGCLYGGFIAVPAYPPARGRAKEGMSRLTRMLKTCDARAVLTNTSVYRMIEPVLSILPELKSLDWLNLDRLPHAEDRWRPTTIDPSELAFLQYTSGSTSAPKGVMVSHANIMDNQRLIQEGFGTTSKDVVVGWLPMYHDMGLIGNLLHPLYLGMRCVLMAPLRFLRNPLNWPRAIHQWGGTVSGGPNFAYDWCVDRISRDQIETLDLSGWRIAFNGAEPVRPETLTRFAAAFAPSGFKSSAFTPCYGLAEATLMVSVRPMETHAVVAQFNTEGLEQDTALPDDTGRPLVSSGKLSARLTVTIRDQNDAILPDGKIGEVNVEGRSVANGYWEAPEISLATFKKLPDGTSRLRTGDLGFFHQGELFITGRIKDLMIIRGKNYYPQDLEHAAEDCHPAVSSDIAAFIIDTPDGEQRLILVAELTVTDIDAVAEAGEAIRAAISEIFQLQVYDVVFIKRRTIPKTTSGKIRRMGCREAYLVGELKIIGRDQLGKITVDQAACRLSIDAVLTATKHERIPLFRIWMSELLGEIIGVPATTISKAKSLHNLGLDSLKSVEIKAAIYNQTGVVVSLESLLEGIDFDTLAEQCLDQLGNTYAPIDHPQRLERTHYPLSYAQQGIWSAAQFGEGGETYNIPAALALHGKLDHGRLKNALARIIARHEALHTCFQDIEGRTRQVILDLEADLPLEDWSGREVSNLLDIGRRESRMTIDLSRGPMYRTRLLKLEPERHVLFFIVHHIVADGWSMGLLIEELAHYYDGGTELPALPYRYADFALWERERLHGDYRERLLRYWKTKLAGLPSAVRIPYDYPNAASVELVEGDNYRQTLSGPPAKKLKTFSAANHTTPFTVMLAVFNVLLHRHAGQDDLAVGSAVLGRDAPGSEQLVGNFVNMLVMRTSLAGDPSFAELLERTHQTALDAFAHRELRFELLINKCFPEHKSEPLFRVALGFQNQPRKETVFRDLEVTRLHLDAGYARYDLTLWVSQVGDDLLFSWTYATGRYRRSTIEKLHQQTLSLLEDAIGEPSKRVSVLRMASPTSSPVAGKAFSKLGKRPAARAKPAISEI